VTCHNQWHVILSGAKDLSNHESFCFHPITSRICVSQSHKRTVKVIGDHGRKTGFNSAISIYLSLLTYRYSPLRSLARHRHETNRQNSALL